jgi:hypothetical protein
VSFKLKNIFGNVNVVILCFKTVGAIPCCYNLLHMLSVAISASCHGAAACLSATNAVLYKSWSGMTVFLLSLAARPSSANNFPLLQPSVPGSSSLSHNIWT